MRRRVKPERIVKSLSLRQEQFEVDGVVYRFDARPVLKVVHQVLETRTSTVLALLLFRPSAMLAGIVASYGAWCAFDLVQERYWQYHHVLPEATRLWLHAHGLPGVSDVLHFIFWALPPIGQ